MQRHNPAQLLIIEPLFQHYRELLELYEKHNGTILADLIPQITMNIANIQSLISFRIKQEQLDRSETIYCAIYLKRCSWHTGHGTMISLMDLVAASLPAPVDHGLEVCFLSESIYDMTVRKGLRIEILIEQALGHFPYFDGHPEHPRSGYPLRSRCMINSFADMPILANAPYLASRGGWHVYRTCSSQTRAAYDMWWAACGQRLLARFPAAKRTRRLAISGVV
ncbi:hypothetical protein GGX14DRAFT_391643 [Mycena pura]|uniref:Uncharacterized protein n=1 Tax=Mycena pura TaxID=153505 RepID=A0AAD6VKZ7_9AGAR|nr:hypothetical protein GGX14DRAFT_391643 [Mycena pura]